jgi:hypothetical protein
MVYNPTNIFTESDLKKVSNSFEVNCDIVIRGEHIKSLSNIHKINGFLGISDSSIESLGELKEISGDFWTSFHTIFSSLKSLGNLEKIGGDASFRYSNISDLGKLKYVGGKLSLRDTQIENLGNLEYVGGDLYLPRRLKNLVDLEKIHIVGKIQFWKDNKNKKRINEKSNLNLTKSLTKVPYWRHEYIFSTNAILKCTSEQKYFYNHYKESFLNGTYIDIEGNDNYAFILFYDLIRDYYTHKDIKQLSKQFEKLEKYYPKTANYTSLLIIEEFEKKGDFETAWLFVQKREFISVQTIWKYEQKVGRKLLDGNYIVKLGGYSHLTEFGQNNIDAIKPFAEKYLLEFENENSTNFFDLFFDKGSLYKATGSVYSPEYYHKFFFSESEYFHYKSIDDGQKSFTEKTAIKYVVEKAILNQLRCIRPTNPIFYGMDFYLGLYSSQFEGRS